MSHTVNINVKPYKDRVEISATPRGSGGTIIINDGESNRIFNEVPDGLLNGSNAIFTSNNAFIPETLEVFLNGLKLKRIDEYNTTGNFTINLMVSPGADEQILINYTIT